MSLISSKLLMEIPLKIITKSMFLHLSTDAVTVVLYNMMKEFNIMEEVTAAQVCLLSKQSVDPLICTYMYQHL